MNCGIYIDAENVSYKSIDDILKLAENQNIIIKKVYANWSNESMKNWSSKSVKYGLEGKQCFGNDKKQTSDVYMITDIINDLYTNAYLDTIILATSDTDFTHLCHVIKSNNKKLIIYTPQETSLSNLDSFPNSKKQKINKEPLKYLKLAMHNNEFLYISEYKKNLRSVIPKDYKEFDINHIDRDLVYYKEYFKVQKKGNRVKIISLF